MHARNGSFNSTPFSAVSLHVFIAGLYFVLVCVLMADLPWCVSSCQSLHVFVLNDSVIQGSLNNHCSNTLDTPGVQINFKKIVTLFVIGRKPSKGETKGILLGS